MPAFNFQKRFSADVRARLKRQTIRAKRKNRPLVGQTAFLYTGMRSQNCQWLGDETITAVHDVRIDREGVLINGGALKSDGLNAFARADGFAHFGLMLEWFDVNHGLPFHGDLVMW